MATIGVTAKLEYESGSSWVEVAGVKTVGFPAFGTTSIDTTHLGVADYGKTFMPGMVDAGSVSFESEYTSDTYTALQGLVRDVIGWRVSAPDGEGDAVTCDGFLTGLSVSMSPDEEVMIQGEIKMTGLPQVTAGGS